MILYRSILNFFPNSFKHHQFLLLSSTLSNCLRNWGKNVISLHLILVFVYPFLSPVYAENVDQANPSPPIGGYEFGTPRAGWSQLEDEACWKNFCLLTKLVPKVDLIGTATFVGTNEVIKVVCKPEERVSIDQLCLDKLPSDTRILEIHNTSSTTIDPSSFLNLNNLRKLDLRYNHLSVVRTNTFRNLSNLRRLDLSFNQITQLTDGNLKGLQQLVRLKLSSNPLLAIDAGIVEEAPSLKAIELSNTELRCDCNLKWLVSTDELNDEKHILRILGNPICHSPNKLNGKKLKKLKPERLICDSTDLMVTNSMVELEPGIDQVVFAGDSLRLRCRVGDSGNVAWKWGETLIRDGVPHSSNHSLKVNVKTIQTNKNVESFIEIPEVSWGHSGEWTCVVDGKRKKNSKSISIYVIHRQTKYCALNITVNNKGTYTWPRTVAQVTVDLPCQVTSHYSSWAHNTTDIKHVSHYCNQDGKWERLDSSNCSYVMETTRILEHFSKTDLISAKASVQESSSALRNFTKDGHVFKYPMDIVFLARTIEQYVKLLKIAPENQQTARTLMEIIVSTLATDKSVLHNAQNINGSCSSLVRSLWELGKFLPYFSMVSTPHFSFNQISFKPEAFGEVSCVWFRKRIYSSDRSFHCGINNSSLFYTIAEDITDARIRIPSSMFTNNTDNSTEIPAVTLQFIAFDSAKLYTSGRNNWQVTSPVIGVRMISGATYGNSSIYITLRSTLHTHNVVPAMWKNYSWSEDGCHIIRVLNSMVFFRCNGLSEYGLLQDVSDLLNGLGREGAPFKPSPIGVYVGSVLCNLLLMASIAIWCIFHQRIGTQGKNKHSYVNTWVALLFLNSLFTVGIYQTESITMCRIIGLVLHYLTTCVLLWIIVSVTNLYKKISKSFRPPVPSEDQQVPPKPMFRFYLVGWGIALILCGISTAVNLDHYSTYHYCFLTWNPSLAAFYSPCVILIFILVAFFLLTHCLLRAGHEGYSETNGNTETTELELLDTVSPNSENPPSLRADDELSVFSQKSILSVADGQHSPMTQLKAHIVTLLLFILTWAAAAMTTASPFAIVVPHHELIFSLIYAVCATSLGLFIFMFFCVCRTDVTDSWKKLSFTCCLLKDKPNVTVTNNIFNSFPNSTNHANNEISMNSSSAVVVAPSVRSDGSSRTITNKSSSVMRSISHKGQSRGKVSNAVNLLNFSVMSEDVQYVPEMFYNPKQSGVARRFFHKQKLKQMMKQNNLEMNRPDSDCNSSTVYKMRSKRVLNSASDISNFDASYLGVSNKINNTNIHVDYMHSGSKHSSKSPTPELLCIFGPQNEACNIVSSMENNQHLWPVASHQHCTPHLDYKMNNKLSNCSEDLSFSGEDSTFLAQQRNVRSRYQPMVYNKIAYPVPVSNDSKDENTAGTDDDRNGKFCFKKRHRKVVQRPQRTKKRSKTRPERQDAEEPPNLEDNDSSSLNIEKLSNDEDLATSFSPLSFSSLPCPTSCLGTPSSISPSSRHADGFSPDCNQLDWMHLLKKRVMQNEEYQNYDTNDSRDAIDEEYSRAYEEEWRQDDGPYVSYTINDHSDMDNFSVATSLIPAVDTSPPGSLPISDSPFDSPLHKLHQNTPDRISLESESHLSQVSSRQSPDQLNVTPTGDYISFAEPTDDTVTPTHSMELMASSELMGFVPVPTDDVNVKSSFIRRDLENFNNKIKGDKRFMKKSYSFTTSSSASCTKIKQSSSLDMGRYFPASDN